MAFCEHPGCEDTVDIDPWIAYPSAFEGVPVLCNEHVIPHVEQINAKIAAIKSVSEMYGKQEEVPS